MSVCRIIILVGVYLMTALCPAFAASDVSAIKDGFQSPPDSARPWVYWFIMDGNLSLEGITADLESMREAGIGGVIIMEVNVGIPRGPVEFMSDEWKSLFAHAVKEAERLGMEITLNAGPGWTGSGGPWVPVEQSMQHLVCSAIEVEGPRELHEALPVPEPREPYFGRSGLPEDILRARAEFYVDEVVIAYPGSFSAGNIPDWDEKALYVRDPYSSMPGVPPVLPEPGSDAPKATGRVMGPERVVDLSSHLSSDGVLEWDVPEGEWTILRFGRRTTGANTRPAPQPGLGFESDKFDKAALELHFQAFVEQLLAAVGPRPLDRKTGWTMLHIDSWEMGAQNWTADFRDEFIERRGYDPLAFLPAMNGYIVGDMERSERFLWDLRLTAQELVLERHAHHLKELGRGFGFGLSIEPYDMNPTTDMLLGGVADVPMCEFWAEDYGFDTSYSCHEAASIAHVLGRPVVAAEAFTSAAEEAWQLYPGAMKNQGDWAFCTGINRFAFHRFAHQPWLDRRPGMTMGPYGVHWDRTQTWWPMISDYHEYVARCQFPLRQGTAVADICYLLPEDAPNVFTPPASALIGDLGDRRGYNFDGCPPDFLSQYASVENGRIVFPSGASYRLLVLPARKTMTPKLLGKIKELVAAGAVVTGDPPERSPSLSGYPMCDVEVQRLSGELWGTDPRSEEVMERQYGKGRVVWGGSLSPARADGDQGVTMDQARWIWFPEGTPAREANPSTRYFRRVVAFGEGFAFKKARLEITADNSFQAWVNGRLVGSGNNFNFLESFDVTDMIRVGENIIAVEAVNGGDAPNPAGLIALLHGELADGTPFAFGTSEDWQAAKTVSSGWQSLAEPGEGWDPAMELGPADMGPWALDPAASRERPEIYPEYGAVADLLQGLGLDRDFQSNIPIRYIHRKLDDADLYFVANRTNARVSGECTFRAGGKHVELWDPMSGDMFALHRAVMEGGRTKIPLTFEPFQSFFVCFRGAYAEPSVVLTPADQFFAKPREKMVIGGRWTVSFDPSAGGPGVVEFSELQDWREREEPGIRFYSGLATYQKDFEVEPGFLPLGNSNPIWVELGEVHNMARVTINGREAGVVWCDPWRIEVGNWIMPGLNRLEIQVANLWPNRLIGDAGQPEDERWAWTTWNPYREDSALLPSGLLGPVELAK
jgi:hypothetical protein